MFYTCFSFVFCEMMQKALMSQEFLHTYLSSRIVNNNDFKSNLTWLFFHIGFSLSALIFCSSYLVWFCWGKNLLIERLTLKIHGWCYIFSLPFIVWASIFFWMKTAKREAFQWNQKINSQHMYGVDSGICHKYTKMDKEVNEKKTPFKKMSIDVRRKRNYFGFYLLSISMAI